MAFDMKKLEVVGNRVFVVHHRKSGKIVHVHSVLTHRGAKSMSDDDAQKRALIMAGHLGHATEKLAVLRLNEYSHSSENKVDVKTGKVVASKGKKKSR
jgi:hypothetical protein